MANVLETDFQYYAMDDFRVRMPDINIEVILAAEIKVN